ncbi:hypothetical protein F4809DRAFT_641879 [Biscogniauxia mediterranea]|nr:hypothetical protein F4809DRAFT_641879 [Biscogniauxia mediterranea]
MAAAAARGELLAATRQRTSQILSRLAGSTRHRFYPLKHSPNRILALYLRSKNREQRARYAAAVEYAARQRSERLPIATLRAWLKQQDLSGQEQLSENLLSIPPAQWNDILKSLAARGWTEDHLNHWIWILSGENGDVRVERILSREESQPIFILLLLFRSDEVFRKPKSLISMMDYISKYYIFTSTSHPSAPKKMTPHRFNILLSRLVMHTQRIAPRWLVNVAKFARDYITEIPRHFGDRAYRYQCLVFNTALVLLKRQAPNEPLANMEFNWRAQRVLLAMSDGLEEPLAISRRSYRAIRQVLIGMRRTGDERAVARRYAKSWPPYRQDFDGVDAMRTPEDDRSRSIKAGVLMTEAGYEKDNYDRALDTLGGMGDSSPTIQTRSQAPKEWEKEEGGNSYTLWAMNIRATRNTQEAWRAFRRYADRTGARPNYQVYGEMFLKLIADDADPDFEPLPGDARENLPTYDANYSPYELARLAPPTVAQLYDYMVSQGVKPRGHYLYKLVAHAKSVEEGCRYLMDSDLNPSSISHVMFDEELNHRVLQRLPLLAFTSYVTLLCRLQPRWQGDQRIPANELMRIRRAIKLANARLAPHTTEGITFRPPWYAILRALARPQIAVRNGPEWENDVEALTMFLDVLTQVQKTVGIDAEFFLLFGRAVHKAALSRLKALQDSLPPGLTADTETPLIPFAQNMLQALKGVFSFLTTPTKLKYMATSQVEFKQPIGPVHLHTYMRALACLDDQGSMIELAIWIFDHWEYVTREAERIGARGPRMMAKTLCAFQAFAGPSLSDEQKAELDARMNQVTQSSGSWRWPTAEEIKNYTQFDARGMSQRLEQRALAKSWDPLADLDTEQHNNISAG